MYNTDNKTHSEIPKVKDNSRTDIVFRGEVGKNPKCRAQSGTSASSERTVLGPSSLDLVNTSLGSSCINYDFINELKLRILSGLVNMQEFALFYSIFSRRYGYLPTTQGS